MLIKLDNRETDLRDLLFSANEGKHTIEMCQLDLGDIIICDDFGNEKLIIERKTVNDLVSSIKDGRYAEQSFRLNASDLHNHNIIYLIEGNINRTYDKRFNKNTILSSFVTITYFKGFSLVKTTNIQDTVDVIMQYTTKIGKEKTKIGYYDNISLTKCDGTSNGDANSVNNYADNSLDYSCVVKRAKKSNITPENIGIIMLSQIPGVSVACAKQIIDKFNTVKNLLYCLENDPECLDNIKMKIKGDREKKINKTAVINIKKYLFQ